MKLIIPFLAWMFFWSPIIIAQNSTTPVSSNDIAVKLNGVTGQIDLVYKQNSTVVTADYQLSKLEITIFDENGDYAGTLNLQSYLLPKNEVDANEKLKVANLQVQHKTSGQVLTFSNVDFTR